MKTLLLRNANDGNLIDASLLKSEQSFEHRETTSSSSENSSKVLCSSYNITDDAFTTTIISTESNVSIMSNSNYIGDDYVHTISTNIDLNDTIVLTDVSTVENQIRNYRINSHNIHMQTKANAVNDLPCEKVNNDNIINLTPNNNEENYDALTANETSNKILCNYRDEEKLIILMDTSGRTIQYL